MSVVCDFLEEGKRCIISRQDLKLSVGKRVKDREGRERGSKSEQDRGRINALFKIPFRDSHVHIRSRMFPKTLDIKKRLLLINYKDMGIWSTLVLQSICQVGITYAVLRLGSELFQRYSFILSLTSEIHLLLYWPLASSSLNLVFCLPV